MTYGNTQDCQVFLKESGKPSLLCDLSWILEAANTTPAKNQTQKRVFGQPLVSPGLEGRGEVTAGRLVRRPFGGMKVTGPRSDASLLRYPWGCSFGC